MGRLVNPVAVKKQIRKEIQKNVFTTPAEEMPYKRGLGSTLFRKMLENGDQVAQTDGVTGKQETYKFLLQKATRAAITLRSKGLTSDDVITICSFHHLDTCVPYLAALFLGAKTASIDPSIPVADAIHLLKQVGPKMVFVNPASVSLIEETLKKGEIEAEIVVFGNTPNYTHFSEFLTPSVEDQNFAPVEVSNLKDTAGIFFSSGTTGLPKGILLNHYGLLGCMHGMRCFAEPGDSVLMFASYHWISSTLGLICCILNAANRVLYSSFDSNKVWHQISDNKVNLVFVPPISIIAACKAGLPNNADISTLRCVLIGGGPIYEEQLTMIRKSLPKTIVLNTYGQTEVSGAAVFFRSVDIEDIQMAYGKPAALGKFQPGTSYKIVNSETEEALGANQQGELRIKSDFVMNGYHNMASSHCWDSDGFLKTGDIVYYDDDHCLFIVDRIKELMKFQMWHVPPAKLEGVLMSHPVVQSAVVFGLPHPDDGDLPTAAVVLSKSEVTTVTADDLAKYVQEKVDDRERLRGGVKIVKSIPLTATGKLSRMHMRSLVLRGEL